MSNLVTEARVEVFVRGKRQQWLPVQGHKGSVPHAVEMGRAFVADEHDDVTNGHRKTVAPVRVIDTDGAVVAQWGKP